MEQSIPEGYVRLEEAVTLTNRSEKTVRNWADRKLIGKRKWRGMALYRRSDLETQLAKEAETQIVQNPSGPPMVAQMGGAIATAIAEQFSRILPPASDAVLIESVPLAEKPRVTLREAVKLGYQADDLVSRVKDGTLENVGTRLDEMSGISRLNALLSNDLGQAVIRPSRAPGDAAQQHRIFEPASSPVIPLTPQRGGARSGEPAQITQVLA